MNSKELPKWAQAVEARVEKHGGTVDWSFWEDGFNEFLVDAPENHTWAEGDSHALMVTWFDAPDRPHALKDLWERLAFGHEPCSLGKNCSNGCWEDFPETR